MRGFPQPVSHVVVFSSVLPMFTPTPMSFAAFQASRSSALAVADKSRLIRNAARTPAQSLFMRGLYRSALKESPKKRRRAFRDADDLVGCLAIEFEVEFGLGAAIVPVGIRLELSPPETLFRERSSLYGDAHARGLALDSGLPWRCPGRGNNAPGNQTWPAFVLARENENLITFGDTLAAVHRLPVSYTHLTLPTSDLV